MSSVLSHVRMGLPTARRGTLLVLITALVVMGGAWRAWGWAYPTGPVSLRVVAVGQPAPSRAGLVTVTGVERVNGLTDQDLGGMSHGVTGLVDAGHAMIRVTVRLKAPAGGSRGQVDPANFAVRLSPTGTLVSPVGSSLQRTALEAGEVEGTLGFVIPRDGSAMALEMVDGATRPVTVDIGKVDVASQGTDMHMH